MLRIFKWCRLLYWILIATDSFRLQCPKVISTDYTGQTSCRRVSLRKLNSFTRSKLIFCSTKLIWYGKSLWNLNASSSIPNCSFPSSFCFLFIWSREVSNQWEFEDQRAGKCARRPRYIAFSLPHMVDRSGWHKILNSVQAEFVAGCFVGCFLYGFLLALDTKQTGLGVCEFVNIKLCFLGL